MNMEQIIIGHFRMKELPLYRGYTVLLQEMVGKREMVVSEEPAVSGQRGRMR